MSEARPRALVVDPGFSSGLPYVRLLQRHFDLIPAFTPSEGLAELDSHDSRQDNIDVVISRRNHLPEVIQIIEQGPNCLVVTAGTLLNAELQVVREATWIQAAGGTINGESAGRTAILRLQADIAITGGSKLPYNF